MIARKMSHRGHREHRASGRLRRVGTAHHLRARTVGDTHPTKADLLALSPLCSLCPLWLILLALMGEARAEGGPSDAEVARAIARGVAFVKAQQEPKGAWSYSFNHDHALGITALAGLALLENGVDRADPAIAAAAEAVRSLAPRSDQTYDLALAILFLARVQARPGARTTT